MHDGDPNIQALWKEAQAELAKTKAELEEMRELAIEEAGKLSVLRVFIRDDERMRGRHGMARALIERKLAELDSDPPKVVRTTLLAVSENTHLCDEFGRTLITRVEAAMTGWEHGVEIGDQPLLVMLPKEK